VDDVTAEGPAAIPENHHVHEVFETVAPGELVALCRIKQHAVNLDLAIRRDEYLFDPRAARPHQQLRAFLSQTGVEVKHLAGLRTPLPLGADRVTILTTENRRGETLLEVVKGH
jgi:hypothetical protein